MKSFSFLLGVLFYFLSIGDTTGQIAPTPVEPITKPIPVPITPNGNPTNNGGTTTPLEKQPTTDLGQEAKEAEKKKKKEESDKQEEERKIRFNERQEQLPQAKIWGQQLFRDKSIEIFSGNRDIKAIDKYLLGVGDEISVTIWGRTDYSASEPIDEDGYISLSNPYRGTHIPRLYLKGMRFDEARKAIVSRLKNHMNVNNSQASITLNYSRSVTINITGEVFDPGSYTIPAVNTAFNALVASGGPSQIGSVRNIKVFSSERKVRTLDVYEFIKNPKIADDFFLVNNDYIYIPRAERVVELEGAIERPYFYELIEGEDLLEVIEHAGGLRPDAYQRNIQIIRYENDEEKLIDVDLATLYRSNSNFELKNGDRISIDRIEQAYANYVTVKGAVRLPGSYEIKSNSTISEVLIKSGIIRSAIMQKIYVKRLREDLSIRYIPINIFDVLKDSTSAENLVLKPFDEIEVKYKADFIDKYNVKIYGAIRQPGDFEYSDSLTLADVLYMANGIKLEATNSIAEISRLKLDEKGNRTYVVFKELPINSELVIEGAENFSLEPYDQIFIRKSKDFETPQNIQIDGEIHRPGLYTMQNKEERVLSLISRAGGITEAAFLEGAQLIRRREGLVLLDLEKLLDEGEKSRFNYILLPGDRVIIPTHKNLVSIAGRVNHPHIKETAEIELMERDLELAKLGTPIEQKEYLLDREKAKIKNPLKVNIPFHEGKRANFYIKEYGAGIDRKLGGRKRLVYVRYANGAVKKTKNFLFFKKYPKVEKGAMVYVDEKEVKIKKVKKNPVNWYRVITDSLAVVTSGLTIYALIAALQRQPEQ